MQHILLPVLDTSNAYTLNFDGDRWAMSTMALDSRSAGGEYVCRFGPVVGYGVRVEVGADIGLVPGMQTVLTVLDGIEDGGDS